MRETEEKLRFQYQNLQFIFSQNDLMTVDNESESLRLSMLWSIIQQLYSSEMFPVINARDEWENRVFSSKKASEMANLQIAQFSSSRKYHPLSALFQLFR